MSNYEIKHDYAANLENDYYDDTPEADVTWQPDVYEYAVSFALDNNIKNIIDIGSGNGEKLKKYKNKFNITFIDFGPNLDIIRNEFKSSTKQHSYVDQNFEQAFPSLPAATVADSVIICSDVMEHIRDMTHLLKALTNFSKQTKLLIVSTPDRRRTYGFDQDGTPTNRCHVREWNVDELGELLRVSGMKFSIGLTRSNDFTSTRATICFVSGQDFSLKKSVTYSADANYLDKIIGSKRLPGDVLLSYVKNAKKGKGLIGLFNPLKHDFFANHFVQAVSEGYSIKVNIFKYLNEDTTKKSTTSGIEGVDRLLVQYLETAVLPGKKNKTYPLSFTLVYDHTITSKDGEGLPTMALGSLPVAYLPELFFGFSEGFARHDAHSLLANQANQLDESTKLRASLSDKDDTIARQAEDIVRIQDEYAKLLKNPAKYGAELSKKISRRLKRD